MALSELARHVWEKAQRDRALGPREVARRGARYLRELATAPLNLRGADRVGAHPRTLGRPRIENHGRLIIGDHAIFRSVNVPLELVVEVGATLTIGDECHLEYGVSIAASERITIGDRAHIGPYVMIIDSEYHHVYDRAGRPSSRPVVIEDDVWIGAKASILPGVTVGRGSIVGAGAVVTKDVPPFSIAGGVPAKVIGQIDRDRFEHRKKAGVG